MFQCVCVYGCMCVCERVYMYCCATAFTVTSIVVAALLKVVALVIAFFIIRIWCIHILHILRIFLYFFVFFPYSTESWEPVIGSWQPKLFAILWLSVLLWFLLPLLLLVLLVALLYGICARTYFYAKVTLITSFEVKTKFALLKIMSGLRVYVFV